MGRLLYALIYFLSGFFPRNRRKVLFGAWLGKKFSDNPKYLLLYLTKHQANLDFVWIGEESVRSAIPENLPVRFITRGSLAAWWEMLTAGTCFVTHGFADLGTFNLMRGAKRIYLGHGLAIKHMGSRDSTLTNRLLAALRRCLRNSYSFDFYIASSPAHQVKLLIEYATCNAEIHQILQCGQPRVDYLLENSMPVKSENFRNRFFATNGFPQSYRVITYLPTFRDKNSRIFSFTALDPKQRTHLDELLVKLNAVILEKNHFADVLRGGGSKSD